MNSQSNVIFAAAMIAFVIFITKRGSLQNYLSVLLGTAQAPASDANANITGGSFLKFLNGGQDIVNVKPGSVASGVMGLFGGGK